MATITIQVVTVADGTLTKSLTIPEAQATRMIAAYQSLTAQPSQVVGDDTVPGYTQPWPYYRPLWTRLPGPNSF